MTATGTVNGGGRIIVSRHTRDALGQLERIFGRGTVAGLNEAALLQRFAAERDEAALAAIVARHGPMVLGVCRRVLRDEHDVEDAFQATFLVLVRRAGTLRDGNRVGPWLHGVAHRVAVRARANRARRHARTPCGGAVAEGAAAPPAHDAGQRELRAILDDELARLPEALRAPLVLCYLEGLTHDEAAQQLGWPVGTVRSRMARARDRLRSRLARRGFTGDEAALTNALAAPPVSSGLLDATVKASLGFASHQTAAGVASATAVALAQGVLHTMMIAKLKALGAAALACVIAVGGVETYAHQFGGQGANKPDRTIPETADKSELLLSIERVRRELTEVARRNAELQKEVQALRAELKAMRSATPAGASKADDDAEPPIQKGDRASEEFKVKVTNAPFIRMGDHFLLAISPQGDRVVAYDTVTKKSKSLRLSDDNTTARQVIPIVGPGVMALVVEGPRITRLGVFDYSDQTWYPVDLRKPVDKASPMVSPGRVDYHLGRYYYIFTGAALAEATKRWDVVEVPEGFQRPPTFNRDGSITYEEGAHIYTFNRETGKWDDFDTRTILDTPEDQDKAKPEGGSKP